jgi:hypothetical protein
MVAAALDIAPAAAAKRSGFVGVATDGPLRRAELNRVRGLGMTVRFAINWPQVEPQPGRYDFSVPDEQIGLAADYGARALPVVFGTPAWISDEPARPPLGPRGLRRWRFFLSALVRRYGTRGSFWRGRAVRRPVRSWQIWNEPNFRVFWRSRISPRGYAHLLGAATGAIRRHDRSARIVAAGLAPIENAIKPWEYLRRLYRVPGARRLFDVAALHPYAAKVGGVEYEVWRTRQVMREAGAGDQPLLLSEVGVASHSAAPTLFDRGRRGQARFLEHVYARLSAQRRRWRIGGVYWYTWRDPGQADSLCSFCEGAGLFDAQGRAKPAWRAFRRVLRDAAVPSVR